MYKRALIKRCATLYNFTSEEISSHVCNTAVTEKKLQNDTNNSNNSINHNEHSDEEMFIDWNLEGLE